MTKYLATIHIVFETDEPPTVFLMDLFRHSAVLNWTYIRNGSTRRILPFLPVEVGEADPIHNLAVRYGALKTWRPIR